MKCKVLIVGAPRSGTHYAARLLRAAGLQVRHEDFGIDGSVSSLLTVDDYYYPYHKPIHWDDGTLRVPRRSEVEWEHVFHQVRDPLQTISSMCHSLPPEFWHWQERHSGVGGDMQPIERRAMKFWVQWNHMAEQLADLTYRVEDMKSVWPTVFEERLGLFAPDQVDDLPTNINAATGEVHRYSWDELMEIDPSAARTVQFYARRWGYSTR